MTNEYSSKAEEILNWLSPGSAPHRKGEALKQLTDLITQARIDELEMIDSRGELYAPYIKKRYDELQSTLKKEQ